MAYLNPDKIGDVLARDLIDRFPEMVEIAMIQTDRDINIACLNVGVVKSLIPVDIDGVTESDVLLNYGETMLVVHLLMYAQGAIEKDDSYGEKVEQYTIMSEKYKKTITYFTITGNEEIRLANRITPVPVW